MPKRTVLILGLMLIWLGLNQSAALAYESCIPPTPSETLQMADAVFAGKVIAANQEAWRINRIRLTRYRPFILLTEDDDRYRTTFEVTKVWKGDVTARTAIIHSIDTCGASYSFRLGEEYIVYAKWFKGELHNAWCHRNKPLIAAGEDLLALGKGKPPAPNPSSLIDNIGSLAVSFAFLAMFGWAVLALRRKYGARKS